MQKAFEKKIEFIYIKQKTVTKIFTSCTVRPVGIEPTAFRM